MNIKEKKRQEILEKKYELRVGIGYPMGVVVFNTDWVQFTVTVPGGTWCRIHFYHSKNKKKDFSLVLEEKYRRGSVFSACLTLPDYEDYQYEFESEQGFFPDLYAVYLPKRKEWGKHGCLKGEKGHFSAGIRKGVSDSVMESRKEKTWRHRLNELIIYRIHTRGFTKHSSSGVKAKGTFLGIEEKIPYLVDLGINAVELMPCYDFNECLPDEPMKILDHRFDYTDKVYPREHFIKKEDKEDDEKEPPRLNYWGYTEDAFYFAPKASYASDREHPEKEFEHMVQALHDAGIEVIMEMYFPTNAYPGMIVDCLKYWSHYFNIDGFHLSNANSDAVQVMKDPYLSDTRIFANGWQQEILKERFEVTHEEMSAYYTDNFMVTARRYLKADDGMVHPFVDCFHSHPSYAGVVNYMASTNGFTMMDLVSYDRKHNEVNGEDNRDGTDYNYSWNCGFEGPSRKKSVRELRKKQLKNAFMMLCLSQGIPMMMAGDEFGNTQGGNNNAYCQDNEVGWVNWKKTAFGNEIRDFVRELICIRKGAPHFHGKIPLRKMDYLNCGYPDFSIHGTKAWYPDYSHYSRFFGAMFTGKYFEAFDKEEPENYFVVFNMYWEAQDFGLPVLTVDKRWKLLLSSGSLNVCDEEKNGGNKKMRIEARSAALFVSENVKTKKNSRSLKPKKK